MIERADRTVTSLKPGAAPAPETKSRPIGTSANGRRIVRLTAITDVKSTPAPRRAPEGGGAHRAARSRGLPTSRDDLLIIAERIVGDWAATLRAALLLLLAVVAAIAVIGIVFGAGPALVVGFLALLVFLAGRRRGHG